MLSPLKAKGATGSLDNLEEQMKNCQSESVSLDLIQNLNLPLLPSSLTSEPHLIEFLRKCFKRKLRFLSIGPLVIASNRAESLPSEFKTDVFDSMFLSEEERHQILNSLSPNYASLALSISASLKRTSHAIFFLGDTGSGKSRCLKELSSHLIFLSSVRRKDRVVSSLQPSKLKDTDLELKLFEQASLILDSFGHCQITGNSRSSRYSKAVDLSFNEHFVLEGIHFRCFHLEFNRTVVHAEGESNFKVFYDIFDDIFFAEQALNKYDIENLTSFRYTSKRPKTFTHPGKSTYKSLVAGLQSLSGITKNMQTVSIFNILAVILHLGDIDFDMNSSSGETVTFSSEPKSCSHQNKVLKFLGITLESLLGALTKKSIKIAGETVEANLEVSEARVARDNFACHLYAALFRWVLSTINVGLSSQLPIKLDDSVSPMPPSDKETQALRSCHLYDLIGFENLEHNQLDQLCVNYANERMVHILHQTIFQKDLNLFESDGITVPEMPFPDNTLVVRTLDNRTNGLFLLSEEQLRLKGSTDQKLAQYFYAQHSSNKCFFAAKAEQKSSEFILQHYSGNVKYEINGFLARNRGEPTAEIIACLKSSSIQFVRDELAFHCEKAAGAGSRLSISGSSSSVIPENSMDSSDALPSPSPAQRVIEKRPSLVKSRSAAFIPDPEKSPSRGLSRASSMVSRNGSLRAQGKTLTQLTASYMNDIFTEANASEARYFLCLKLNNSFDPTTFDPVVVAQQLRPFSVLEIMSFYKQTFPHRLSLMDFVDAFAPVAIVTIRDSQLFQSYLQDLTSARRSSSDCRASGDEDQWMRLGQMFVKLIPDLPEMEPECQILRSKESLLEGVTLFDEVLSGIRVGQRHVYLSGLSFYYLTGALRLALKLIGLRVWSFYCQRRFSDDQKLAGVKIGMLMKKFLVRRKAKKQTMQLATIAMTQLALKRMRDAKKAKAEAAAAAVAAAANAEGSPESKDIAEPEATEVNGHSSPPPPAPASPQSESEPKTESALPPSDQMLQPSADRTESLVALQPASPALPAEGSYEEQQELIRSLREENISLKRQLINMSNLLAEATRPTPPAPPAAPAHASRSPVRIQSSVRSASSVQSSPPPYNPARKVLKTQSSSLETFSLDSVYGGDLSRDLEPTVTELKPEYEVFVERTLKTLKEDISYLLAPTPFYKFGRTGSCHQTFIQLTPNFQSLTWVPHSTLTKSRDDCIVHLRAVWRLVEGQSTLPFQSYKGLSHGNMPPHRSFSIIYGFRSLDLCAMDDEVYRKWFSGLRYVLQLMNGEIQEAGFDRQYLRKKWNCVDKKNRGFLSRREVIQLIANMDILFDRASFTTAVMRSTIGHSLNNEITFSQFDSLIYQLRRRPDLEIIWNRILNGYDFSSTSFQPLAIDSEFDSGQLQEVIGISDVQAFWKASQGRDLTEMEARALVAEGMGEMHQGDFPVLSYNGFMNIMTHAKNDGYDPVRCVHHARDMCYPLQHYFISCSDGVDVDIPKKEVKSNSLLEETHRPNCYANAINSGCRALELRCFEARVSPNSEIIDVFVGHRKLTTRVTFKETMILIQRIAFLHTQFPLILMLEVSCGIYQQRRIATLLRKVFGDMIFTPLEAKSKLLPSPADLRNRVVIFLSHRKRDIDSAYKIYEGSEVGDEDSKFEELNGTPLRRLGDRPRDLKKSSSSIKQTAAAGAAAWVAAGGGEDEDEEEDRARRRGSGGHKQDGGRGGRESNWFNDMKYYSDLDSDGSDREFSLSKPLNTVRQNSPKPLNSISASVATERKYHLVDPEVASSHGGGARGVDLNEEGAIDASLMRLCHYSKGHKLFTHNLKVFLEKLVWDPSASEAMIAFNMSKFSCIYMDSVTKSYGSYGGICQAWDSGVSMVSICREYPSLGTKLIHGKFRQNGGCGFILKPEKFRSRPSDSSVLVSEAASASPATLAVHIISGQELPEAFVDPETMPSKVPKEKGYSVVIDLNASSVDQDDIQAKTLYIRKHGRNPFWNELFTFAIQDRSRGQLTLRIFHNEECVCFTSVPLSCLRVGYRSMTLFEENEDNNYQIEGLPLSKLFLRIGILHAPTPANALGLSRSGSGASAADGTDSPQIKSQYSKEFSPAMSMTPSPSPPPRARDSNSRMVGMDVSPGNKHWRRLLKSKSQGAESAAASAAIEDSYAQQHQSPEMTSPPPKQQHRGHARRSASTGDAVSPPSSGRVSHRDRDKDSRRDRDRDSKESRDRRRSRRERDRGVPSRSQSGPAAER